ncbi:hypothetical protein NOR53_162 [gamma proteobacterium NOR5-3]|nr:hypothetical protein NOR53_162 [gamma proteobacterium NOR5-3]
MHSSTQAHNEHDKKEGGNEGGEEGEKDKAGRNGEGGSWHSGGALCTHNTRDSAPGALLTTICG